MVLEKLWKNYDWFLPFSIHVIWQVTGVCDKIEKALVKLIRQAMLAVENLVGFYLPTSFPFLHNRPHFTWNLAQVAQHSNMLESNHFHVTLGPFNAFWIWIYWHGPIPFYLEPFSIHEKNKTKNERDKKLNFLFFCFCSLDRWQHWVTCFFFLYGCVHENIFWQIFHSFSSQNNNIFFHAIIHSNSTVKSIFCEFILWYWIYFDFVSRKTSYKFTFTVLLILATKRCISYPKSALTQSQTRCATL